MPTPQFADELFKCVFDHFVGLAVKGLSPYQTSIVENGLLLKAVKWFLKNPLSLIYKRVLNTNLWVLLKINIQVKQKLHEENISDSQA